MANSFPSSSSSPRRNDKAKRKYSHEPLMRVEKQTHNSEGSSYRVVTAASLAQPKIVFQTTSTNFQNASKPTNHAQSSPFSKPKPVPAVTNHSFVLSTVGSMKNGERPTVLVAPSRPYEIELDYDQPAAKRRRLLNDASAPRKRIFRTSRPLKISDKVNSDIWQTILGYCDPKLLLEARTINQEFRQLLQDRTAIWKESRENTFGQDMPDCPTGTTEQQYADLLVGRGCQNRNCPKEQTAGVYWTFQVRLCADCFKQKTLRPDELPIQRRHHLAQTSTNIDGRPLWELLPLARSDGRRYMRPRSVDISANGWATAHSLRQYVFLKSSYMQLENHYLDLMRNGATIDASNRWIEAEHTKTMEFMSEVAHLEAWYKRQKSSDTDLQEVRSAFFQARAAELTPPIPPNVLQRMAAFRRILKVQTPPTLRSWKTLKPKVEPYRAQAEMIEQYALQMLASTERIASCTPPAIKLYRRLHEHRSNREAERHLLRPEQDFVLKLARKEFAQCLNSRVADSDILLLCLKNVFDAYGQLTNVPNGLNYDGSTGPYRLSLDDARMIVEEVMERHIPKMSLRGGAVFQNLRCRGCRRTDFTRSWSFTDAFEHILHVHAMVVGQGLEFWQFAVPYAHDYDSRRYDERRGEDFPWYTVPWPRCLPLVPSHQDTSTLDSWHPAITMPFVQQYQLVPRSAFDDRIAKRTNIPPEDFAGNLVHAAETMNGVWLDGACQMRIALRYALDLYAQAQAAEPPISVFATCLERFRIANPTIELRFRCGVCVGEGKIYRTARQVKYKVGIESLLLHWEDKHAGSASSWSQSLMQLSSDSEVMQQILDADQKLQQDRETTRERTEKLPENVRKRPRLKGSVVLNARSAGDVFDELFNQVGGAVVPET